MPGGGMIPAIWGPMAWRAIHGAAHRYDTSTEELTQRDALVFCLVLIRLAWVLPCVYCRVSYTDYLRGFLQPDMNGVRPIDLYFQHRKVRDLAVEIHDLVNRKLGKPLFDNVELAHRRSMVWSAEFTSREFLGLLFIVAINYQSNGEPDKELHYRRFFEILPEFCLSLGHSRLAASLEAAQLGELQPFTQEALTQGLYQALLLWTSEREQVPSLEELVDRYTLCRS